MEVSKIGFTNNIINFKGNDKTVKTKPQAIQDHNLNGLNITGIYNQSRMRSNLEKTPISFSSGNYSDLNYIDEDSVEEITDTTEASGNTSKLQKAIRSAIPHLDNHTLIVVSNSDKENTAFALRKVIENEVFDNYGYITSIINIVDERIPNPIFIGLNTALMDNESGHNKDTGKAKPAFIGPYQYLISGEGCSVYNDNDEYEETSLTTSVLEVNVSDKLEFVQGMWPVKMCTFHPDKNSELKYCQKIDTNDFFMMQLADAYNTESPATFFKNTNKIVDKTKDQISTEIKHPNFSDVGGQKKAIRILEEEVLFPLIYPEAFGHIMNKGTILQGPPGTGKTHIAKSLANEIENRTGKKVTFVDIDGTSLTSSGVGDTEASWRKLFAEAKQNEPCIIFIDEFESVAQKRDGSSNARYDDKTVNQILTLMSDLEKSNKKVFVLAATNQIGLLDSAITRDGRFGRIIPVLLPDREGCGEVYDIHINGKNVSDDFDKEKIIQKMYDMHLSSAEITGTIERAKRIAYRRAGIYDGMRNGTYKPSDLKNAQIIEEDFNEALKEVKEKNETLKGKSRVKIQGFNRK